MDRIDAQERSRLMSKVRSKDTTPELRVRRSAHSLGLRFRLHQRNLPGTPDLVFPKHKVAILVHGCFWHHHSGCKRASIPKTRAEFWQKKLDRNIERDNTTFVALQDAGWRPEVIWECQTSSSQNLRQRIEQIFSPNKPNEIESENPG